MTEQSVPGFLQKFVDKTAGGEIAERQARLQELREETDRQIVDLRDAKQTITAEAQEKKRLLEQAHKELEALSIVMEFYNSSFLEKFRNFSEYKKTVRDIGRVAELASSMKTELADIESRLTQLQSTSIDKVEIDEMERELDDFIVRQQRAWDNTPYDREDAENDFSTEHLKSLSVDEYVQLLKRYPQDMVTHVTRQGLRDHTGFLYHTAGYGEQHNGFTDMLGDKKIHSVLGLLIAQHGKEAAMEKYLELDSFGTRQEAEQGIIEKIGEDESSGEFADRSAVHFAASEVADTFYGAETGNEIFIAYPSVYIASQFHFGGQLVDTEGGGQNNDLYVWQKDAEGIDIDAGLVFIPKDAQVDPANGSQYEIKDGKGVVDEEAAVSLCNLITSETFSQNVDTLLDLNRIKEKQEINTVAEENERAQKARGVAEFIARSLGGVGDDLIKVLLDHNAVLKLKQDIDYYKSLISSGAVDQAKVYFDKWVTLSVGSALEKHGLKYRRAQETISSEAYWESHFKNNPKNRPSKIVYYEGGDPTTALNNFLTENKLSRKSGGRYQRYGFDDKHMHKDKGAQVAGLDRFRGIAQELISKKYG